MNARDEIAKALSGSEALRGLADFTAKQAADAVLSALEAAGFTIAQLIEVGHASQRRDGSWVTWRSDEARTTSDVPVYRRVTGEAS